MIPGAAGVFTRNPAYRSTRPLSRPETWGQMHAGPGNAGPHATTRDNGCHSETQSVSHTEPRRAHFQSSEPRQSHALNHELHRRKEAAMLARMQRKHAIVSVSVAAIAVELGAVALLLTLGSGPASSASRSTTGTGSVLPSSSTGLAAAIGCTGAHPYVAEPGVTVDSGPKPTGETVCTFAGHTLDIATFASGDDLAGAKVVTTSLLRAYSITTYELVGDNWLMGVTDNGNTLPLSQQLSIVKSAKVKLGAGTVERFGA